MRPKVILEGIEGAIFVGLTVLLAPVIRTWYSKWGSTEAEVSESVPGDEFVPHPKAQLNMAVTIHAPPEEIWPWFVQLGCQRGGWYSYDLLDNGGIPSAEQIIPEFQQLEAGDIVKAMPKGDFGFPVAMIIPNEQLTLAGTTNTETGEQADPGNVDLKAYFSGNQTFLLRELEGGKTRLIFRMRIDWNPSLMGTIVYKGIVEPLSFVMGRKTLLKVKERAEKR